MQTGAITSYIDVAQLVLYAFWIFFAFLILYLRREDKREGYPLESDRSGHVKVQGFPEMPAPKTFLLANGTTVSVPNYKKDLREIAAQPSAGFLGAPLVPTGNAMLDGIGPGSYAMRADVPDTTLDGALRIVPLRADANFWIESRDPDPRGMAVVGADGVTGGTVVDAWVDRSDALIRYFEVEVAGGSRRVLLPVNFSRVDGWRRQVKVQSVHGRHFAQVPTLRNPDQVTLLEEEKVTAFYGAGTLYADPSRQEPFL
jgi:photosynthetic reaction center H subunit